MSSEAQDAVVVKRHGRRRVVVATPIAEASLTIDGVTAVVDGGLARVASVDEDSGLRRLRTKACSKASATQRAGRAGRTRPGRCFRIYSEADYDAFEPTDAPDILTADLTQTVLALLAWGCSNTDEMRDLPWVDRPPIAALDTAQAVLQDLGIVAEDGHRVALTPLGRTVAALPLHPRFGAAVATSTTDEDLAASLTVSTLLDFDALSTKDPVADLAKRRVDRRALRRLATKVGVRAPSKKPAEGSQRMDA